MYDFDYSYSDSVIDDVFDDVIVDSVEQQRQAAQMEAEMAARMAARQQAGPTDYSGVFGGIADAVGGGIGGLYSNYGEAIRPSLTGYYGDTSGDTSSVMNDQELEGLLSMLDSGDLMASNMQGVSDSPYSQVYGGDLTHDQLLDLAAKTNRDEYTRLYTEYYDSKYGSPDSFVSSGYADYMDMLPDYGGFDVNDYIDDLYAGINNPPGEGSGYNPRNVGTGGTPTVPAEGDRTSFPEDADPRNRGFMSSLLSALGLGGIMQGGIGGAFGNILGSMIGGKGSGSPLIDYLMMKSLLKDEPRGSVPIGGQAYGGPAFNYQDYQPTNLQPALMPGVAYANMGPPAMMGGGETKQYPNEGLAALAKQAPEVVERMGYEGGGSIENRPGDITFAKLEPGEFVIQKPAVDAIGIETLRKINSMGDGRPYYG